MKSNIGRQAAMWILVGTLILASFVGGYLLSEREDDSERMEGTYLVVMDDTGQMVRFDSPPERIISLASSATETLFAIGAGDLIVGRDKYSKYPSEAEKIPNIGSGSSPSLEVIIDLEPDLIIAWPYSMNALQPIRNLFTIYYLDPKSVNDVLDTVRSFGAITDHLSEAEELVESIEVRIDAVALQIESLNSTARPKVYYELGSEFHSVGPGTFTDEMIRLAGGTNIAATSGVRYPVLSNEYIVDRDPEVIVVVNYGASPDEITAREGWDGIRAVKDDNVHDIDTQLVSVTPRFIDGLELMAEWFHPGSFGGG